MVMSRMWPNVAALEMVTETCVGVFRRWTRPAAARLLANEPRNLLLKKTLFFLQCRVRGIVSVSSLKWPFICLK